MDSIALSKVDKAISDANKKLERIKIRRQGRRLYLRGSIPKKLGEGTGNKQRDIALGINANDAGVKVAKARAQKLESDLTFDRFDWADWTGKQNAAKTAADWGKEFGRVKQQTIKASSYRNDYKIPLRRLPQLPLSEEVLRDTILKYTTAKPSSENAMAKARNVHVMVYQQVARFAKLPCDLKYLRMKYRPKPINPADLPTDEEIVEIWKSIPYKPYQWAYGMMAVYGLRPHELFRIVDDKDIVSETGMIAIGDDSKTGYREVWTCPDEWRTLFDLADVQRPNIKLEGMDNQEIGAKICQGFRRYNLPHVPYALRHAYAIRTALKRIPDTVAARWMGHSVTVHTQTYHQGISREQHRSVWEDSQG